MEVLTIPYIVKAGPIFDNVLKLFGLEDERIDKYNAFKAKYGSTGVGFVAGIGLRAIPFEEGQAPKGWIPYAGFPGFYFPHAGRAREAAEELRKLPRRKEGFAMCDLLGLPPAHGDGGMVYYHGFSYNRKENWVLLTLRHKKGEALPAVITEGIASGEIEEITMSKYMELSDAE